MGVTYLQKLKQTDKLEIDRETKCGIGSPSQKHVTPLKPHFYIVKVGFTGGIHYFFLFLLKNIDCRYSLELPH